MEESEDFGNTTPSEVRVVPGFFKQSWVYIFRETDAELCDSNVKYTRGTNWGYPRIVLTTIRWIATKFGTDMNIFQRLNYNKLYDPLNFHLTS